MTTDGVTVHLTAQDIGEVILVLLRAAEEADHAGRYNVAGVYRKHADKLIEAREDALKGDDTQIAAKGDLDG